MLLVVSMVAGVVALLQREQARGAADDARSAQRQAEIEALVGRSRGLRTSQRDVAALLAVEAFRLADTPRTRSALFETFTSDPSFLGYHHLPVELGNTQGLVLPDGRTIVAGSDQRPRVYDVDEGALGEPWQETDGRLLGYSRFTASADGQLVAQIADAGPGNNRSLIAVYDANSGTLLGAPIEPPFYVGEVAFDAANATLYVIGGAAGDLVAYSLDDGHVVGTLDGLPDVDDGAQGQIFVDGNPCVLAGRSGPPDPSVIGGTAGVVFAGGLLAVGSPAGSIRLVDPTTLEVQRRIGVPAGSSAHLVAIDSGAGLLTFGSAGVARVDVAAGEERWSIRPAAVISPCNTLAVSESAGRFFYADQFGSLQARDLATGAVVDELDVQHGPTGSLWVTDDGRELVAFGNTEPVIARWRLDGSGLVSRSVDARIRCLLLQSGQHTRRRRVPWRRSRGARRRDRGGGRSARRPDRATDLDRRRDRGRDRGARRPTRRRSTRSG